MAVDEHGAALVRENDMMDLDAPPGDEVGLPGEEVMADALDLDGPAKRKRRVNQRQREAKAIATDVVTTLRNTDLARWNNEYGANMAQASKQKHANKQPTIAKKKAAYWVFGKGIGAVGKGLGVPHIVHPLRSYSGKELYHALCPENERKRRRTQNTGDDSDSDENDRRARPREEQADPMDVEVARHAPSSVLDDRSSLMPWNTIASIESSHRGQHFRSGSELSYGSRRHGRITSASPLAGRGYLLNRDRDSSLDIPGNAGDDLDDLEITKYLEAGLFPDREDISVIDPRKTDGEQRIAKILDQGTLNFWDFLKDKMLPSKAGRIDFETLLPPKETSRTVATQAFMNALTLATKGAISIGQEPYQDQGSTNWGTRYQYGKIWLGAPHLT
jgi:meiotic recombination protein REC8